jgi:hypothetical protein
VGEASRIASSANGSRDACRVERRFCRFPGGIPTGDAALGVVPARRSASLEAGARLSKGAGAFARIVRLDTDVLGERLELDSDAEVCVLVVIQRALGQSNGDGRAAGDSSGEVMSRGQQGSCRSSAERGQSAGKDG